MASRYPTSSSLDYCFNPLRIVHNNVVSYVPCGKCDGCLLHKANEWSMRLGCEIEATPFPIFYTLTYSNKYLPTARFVGYNKEDFNFKLFSCSHAKNIRFDGKKDVLRKEDFVIFNVPASFHGVRATNYECDVDYFPYSSKRDFQLYLKILRKNINERFKEVPEEERKIRSFAISEYGETLLRPHIHAVLFCYSQEISEYLIYNGLFEAWQMCDRHLFQQYTHLCDSGCRGYITQYLTCHSSLPQIYKDDRIKPWRLSSKNPAIGYCGFDKKKVFEDVISGTIEFTRNISRIDQKYILRYPSSLLAGFFPKCYEYGSKTLRGLRGLYGIYLLSDVEKNSFFEKGRGNIDYGYLAARLSDDVHSSNETAAKAAKKVCDLMSWQLDTYLYALDMYYYKADMYALKFYYEWQILKGGNTLEVLRSYQNFGEYLRIFKNDSMSDYQYLVFGSFCRGFALDFDEVINFDFDDLSSDNTDYQLEVSDILEDMVKMPKFNEKYGLSPNSNF